jgi:hypothetical protein
MPFKDPERRRAYGYEWDHEHRPRRVETHTTRAGFANARDRFVAIDGEGYTTDGGRHVYAYLAASDGTHVERIYNPYGLGPRECWEFLLSLPKVFGPAVYVSYSFGYDTEYWIPTLPDRLKRLDDAGRCRYGPYRFLLWTRKRYEVARIEGEKARVRVDDVFSYFGGSFEDAVAAWLPPLSREDSALLHEGKAKRGRFTREDFEDGFIDRYNGLELRLLVELVRKLKAAREHVGIHTSDFYSPANLSVALFMKYGVRITPAPPEVERPAYAAFFGGRIECAAYGSYFGPVYEYDINRAYPAAMSVLPDLSNGRWERSAEYRPSSRWSLYHIRWDFPEGWRFYPFPWRASNGAVFYPPRGSGWIWAPEVRPWMVERGNVLVIDAWHFVPAEDNIPPFGWQADLYRETLEYKRRGEVGPATALKLGQNSCYGKLAQQTSARTELVDGVRVRARPTFHHPCYAGLITSITRARLWDLITEDFEGPYGGLADGTCDSVVSICTDAVYALKPIFTLRSMNGKWQLPGSFQVEAYGGDDEFGSLKLDRFEGIQSLQSGVYRVLVNGEWKTRARGFAQHRVPWDLVNEGWRRGDPSVRYEVPRFVGHRWARAQKLYAARTWPLISKEIRLGAVGKRYIAPPPVYTVDENPTTRLYWTNPEREVEYTAESDPNLPDFTRRPQAPPEGTAEDLHDLGWEEPFEERDASATPRPLVRGPAVRISRPVA